MASREVQVRIKVDVERLDGLAEQVRRSGIRFAEALGRQSGPVWRPWSWYRTSERSG